MLPAMTMNGVIYSHIKKGAYNGNEFVEWLAGLLEIMNPYPAPNSVLILDNCQIHHVEGVAESCAERYVFCDLDIENHTLYSVPHSGVRLIYLPPYSPDLNPIEECFSWVKHCIQQRGAEFRNIVETGHEAEPYLFLYHILNEVPPQACKGWFHHSGYV